MSGADVVAVALAVLLAVVAGIVVSMLASLRRSLNELQRAMQSLQETTLPLVDELRQTVIATVDQVDRVDRLITAAESVEGHLDSASRLAYRTISSPVVKAMATTAGVKRTAQRLTGRESKWADPEPVVAKRRRFRKAG